MRTKKQILKQMEDLDKIPETGEYYKGYKNALEWVLYKDDEL